MSKANHLIVTPPKLLREDYDKMMDELSERELRRIQDRADKASKLIGSQESIDFLNQTWNEGSTHTP